MARIKAFIKERDILRLPEPDQCKIIEMPEFQRGNAMAYLNPAPPLDAKASSYFAISPPPQGLGRAANHELHARIQPPHAADSDDPRSVSRPLRPARSTPTSDRSLIRKVLSSGVFAEGWAVYTEQMMLDEGYGQGDLKLRLNQLKWYLRCGVQCHSRLHACTAQT